MFQFVYPLGFYDGKRLGFDWLKSADKLGEEDFISHEFMGADGAARGILMLQKIILQ